MNRKQIIIPIVSLLLISLSAYLVVRGNRPDTILLDENIEALASGDVYYRSLCMLPGKSDDPLVTNMFCDDSTTPWRIYDCSYSFNYWGYLDPMAYCVNFVATDYR